MTRMSVTAGSRPGETAPDASPYRAEPMPVHCKEPMTRVSLLPGTPCLDAAPTHVLQCRCGFRMDAPSGAPTSLDSPKITDRTETL